MDTNIVNILINIGCSLLTAIATTVIVYFKFLKHIPDETKNQIDTLLNDRLGYETTNHNAVLQKADSTQRFLSQEHSEILQNIITAIKELSSLSGKINNEKELKALQYECLKDSDKEISESIKRLAALGSSLEKVNYENSELRSENEKLIKENSNLKQQIEEYQKIVKSNNFTQGIKF